MNAVVRTPEPKPPARDALSVLRRVEDAAGHLTVYDAAGAQAIIDTGAPAALLAALDVPATKRDVMTALGSVMAAFPNAANKPDLDAYAAVLIDNLPSGLSNVVLQLAAKQLIRRKRFLPAVSEILDAFEAAERHIRDLPQRLTEIASYAAPEEMVWIDKDRDDALWGKVVALQGRRSAPTDIRGGWRFPKSLVEQALAKREAEPSEGERWK